MRHCFVSCSTWTILSSILIFNLMGSGCSTVKLSPDVRASIHSVTIDPNVTTPEGMLYQGTAQTFAGLGGAVGGALGGATASKTPQEAIKDKMAKDGTDLGKMTVDAFRQQLQAASVFENIVETNGDAHIQLKINLYGLARPMGLSFDLKPMMRIEAIMARNESEILWRQEEYITNLNGTTPKYSFKEYMESPVYLHDAFQKAIDLAVSNLVKGIKGT